jgi:hypothetical protein
MFNWKRLLIGNKKRMNTNDHTGTKFRLQKKSLGLHMSKLQATLCLAASVAISVGLIVWGVEAFI